MKTDLLITNYELLTTDAEAIAVAVSGGADSMALLLLAKEWASKNNSKLVAITVNHNLRLEAKSEALQVAKWCVDLGVEHHILEWTPPKNISSAIQEKAREARYQLLTEYCKKNNILYMLTAHTLDDQVETMFFRLARGSGLEGLSAMSMRTIVNDIKLLRPLLYTPKSALVAMLKENSVQWIEDPYNQNEKYSRVRIRKELAKLPNEAEIKNRAAKVAYKFGSFRNLLENKRASYITDNVELYDYGYATFNHEKYKYLPQDMYMSILSSIIQTIGGLTTQPRSEKILSLYNKIKDSKFSKATICGLIFEKTKLQNIMVYRETNALEEPANITANTATLWDKRFLVTCQTNSKNIFELKALGSEGLKIIKKLSSDLLHGTPPAKILRTLPSLWLLEELLCVPHINYVSKQATNLEIQCTAQFKPTKPLAGSPFFVMNNPQIIDITNLGAV